MDKSKETLLIKNIARVLSANFWVAIIGFAGSFIFPKILTIDAYARYHTFTLYVGYIAILHLGFPSGMVINYAGKEYDKIDKKQYKSELIILCTILSVFTIIFAVIFFVTQNKMTGYVALAVIPVGIINSYKSLFQAWNLFNAYTRISTSVATVIPLSAILYYVIEEKLPGDIYICIFLLTYWIVAAVLLYMAFFKVHKIKRERLLSVFNWKTEKTGLALVLGNYVNTLFISADKQFVRIFFSTTEFAYYSFGMSMQSLMTVFIVSIAQPLFPAMAQRKFSDEDYNKVKNLLVVFGSFSGCAYFVISFIVNHFIRKYTGSLQIVGIYFVVFPAMAVVNCLYINLYKIKGLMKTYITTLIGILLTVLVLNSIFIYATGHFTGVAIATTLTYYIWFIIGFRQFKFLKLKIKDVGYLVFYIIAFFVITNSLNDILGFLAYFLFIILLVFCFYKNEIKIYVKK